jgi:MFS family permease
MARSTDSDLMNPRFSGATRLLLAGNTVSMLGTGLVIPFMIIYLHQARGIALPVVGGLLAAAAATGLITVAGCGVLLDRMGARPVLILIMLGQVVAEVALAWAHNTSTAWPGVLMYGATWTPMFSAIGMMLAVLNPEPALQQRAFAVNFTVQNLAIGIGTAIGAFGVRAHHPGSFQVLYLANAASCLLFAAVLPALPNARRTKEPEETRVGYRDVLSHRGLRLILLASLLFSLTGYPAFDSGLPAFASVVAHVSDHVVALSLTMNTAVIVAMQMFMLRLVRRHRRSVALPTIGVIWAVSWVILGLAETAIGPGWRIVCVFAFTGLFGLGETVMAPTMGPLVNILADDRIRGRANSISGFTTSLGLIVCPAIVTGLIAAHLAAVWIALLCLGCLASVVIAARLRVILSQEQDLVVPPIEAVPSHVPSRDQFDAERNVANDISDH